MYFCIWLTNEIDEYIMLYWLFYTHQIMELVMDFKQAFEEQLQDTYLGKIKDIKGDGGYINLIKIKSSFYKDILDAIYKCELEFKFESYEEYIKLIYEHIYTFFSRYLNDTGTPFYSKVKSYNSTYAPVYKDDDVSLFWKTQDLYYIKSEKLFEDMSFDINTTRYIFNTDELKRQTANEKIKYRFMIDITECKQIKDKESSFHDTITIKVMSNKSDDSLFSNLIDLDKKEGLKTFEKEYKKINNYYDESELLEAFRKYKKQSEIDYFIHKNAKIFLEEQLDLYMYNALGRDIITEFNADVINRYRDIRKLASTIIDCIAKFENELKSIWEKPKFVKNSNYIITLDKLSSELVKKLKSEKPKSQQDEWIELSFIDESWDWDKLTDDTYKTLPIDTKYLSVELKYDILASFDELDKAIDGVLIKSDNYQALKTIKDKYYEKLDLIYIDPPFNTGSDFAYKDGFQDSTWLTLMENRLELAKDFLSDQGSFYLHLDYRANYLGRQLLDLQFGNKNFINEIIWCYNEGANSKKYFNRKHDSIYFYSKFLENYIFNNNDILEPYSEGNIKKYKYKDEKGSYRIMGRGITTSPFCSKRDLSPEIEEQYPELVFRHYLGEGKLPKDFWVIDIINQASSERIENQLTQKPEVLLERIIKASSNQDSMIMDYFSGSGTTINTAHKLSRKWIGVEMGDHFYSVIIPRVKATLFGVINGISKELQKNNALKIGGFVKYYELESYDEVLQYAEYKTHDDKNDTLIWDEKLSKALVFNSDNTITFDFSKIGESYINFTDEHSKYSDIAETLSNLFGAEIVKINKNKLTLKGIDQYFDMDNLNFANDTYTTIKKLIWWESL